SCSCLGEARGSSVHGEHAPSPQGLSHGCASRAPRAREIRCPPHPAICASSSSRGPFHVANCSSFGEGHLPFLARGPERNARMVQGTGSFFDRHSRPFSCIMKSRTTGGVTLSGPSFAANHALHL